jgi:hypothetical protein
MNKMNATLEVEHGSEPYQVVLLVAVYTLFKHFLTLLTICEISNSVDELMQSLVSLLASPKRDERL